MMDKSMQEKIIGHYQKDEQMMILIFAQWCVNNDLDPLDVYERAYPMQPINPSLLEGIKLTVPKEEAGEISNETVLGVLSLFGNEDLVFIVNEEIMRKGTGTKGF